jgi:hypothetical protein
MEVVYKKALQAELRLGKTHQEARDAALKTLIAKTTMFSPKILLDNGVLPCCLVLLGILYVDVWVATFGLVAVRTTSKVPPPPSGKTYCCALHNCPLLLVVK